MPLYKYTTTVEAAKTVQEIERRLVAHGARSIRIDYGQDGSVEAMAFKVITAAGEPGFRLPINADAVLKILGRQHDNGQIPRRFVNKPQAVRVAWRILRDWVAAQMAIIETTMVSMEEVFLPYLLTPSGETLYTHLKDQRFQLKDGEKDDA